jgi:hypothetical protein
MVQRLVEALKAEWQNTQTRVNMLDEILDNTVKWIPSGFITE